MTKTDKILETSSPLYENDAKPNKYIFFSYEPNKNDLVKKKMFKLRRKQDHPKYEDSNTHISRGYWTKSDHLKFIEALYLYDCSWKKIQLYIKNRTYGQVRSHAQKYYLKLKTFKDEELGLDFTTPNVKCLNDIIRIVKEKEIETKNYGKILHIISKKLSFGKNIFGNQPNSSANISQESQSNNCEIKIENIKNNEYFNNINNINNIMQLNYQKLLNYTRRMNEQYLNSLLFDNLLIDNFFTGQYLNNNFIINNQQKIAINDVNSHFRQNVLQ